MARANGPPEVATGRSRLPSSVSDHLTLLMEGAIITALVEGDWEAARRAGAVASRLI
jgi:hypothetical protein